MPLSPRKGRLRSFHDDDDETVIRQIVAVIVNCVIMFVIALAFSKHYRKVGQAFCGLARSFELDDRPGLWLKLELIIVMNYVVASLVYYTDGETT